MLRPAALVAALASAPSNASTLNDFILPGAGYQVSSSSRSPPGNDDRVSLAGPGPASNVTQLLATECEFASRQLEPPFTETQSHRACTRCTDQDGCKWCPLTQTCEKNACRKKDEDEHETEIDSSEMCEHATLPPWLQQLESLYRETLQKENKDVLRCIQGRIPGWQVTPDDTMKQTTPAKTAAFGCFSALMRAAFKFALIRSESFLNLEQLEEEEEVQGAQPDIEASTSTSGLETSRRLGGGGGPKWTVTKPTTTLCQILAQIQPDITCEVEVLGRLDFANLRSWDATPLRQGPTDLTEQLARSIKNGPVRELKPGAGKSGSGFGCTQDFEYKIKFGLRDSMWMMEKENLLALIKGQDKAGATPLRQYLQSHPKSLLNRYYAFVRVQIDDEDKYCLLMQDASYGTDLAAGNQRAELVRYDLKGKSRSQTKKQDADKRFTLLNGDFKENENNELKLTNSQCRSFRKAIADDAIWLSAHGMIDYSLFVVISGQASNGYPVGCGNGPSTPFCSVAKGRTFSVSVIDYLNNHNMFKQMEFGKFRNYSGKIIDFANDVCKVDKKEYLTFWQRLFVVLVLFATMACCIYCFVSYGPDLLSDPVKMTQTYQQNHARGSAYQQQPRYGIEMMQPQQMQPPGMMAPAAQARQLQQMPIMSYHTSSAPMYHAEAAHARSRF